MFKLVCGAGNEDVESVKRLVYVYASSGCKLFDISARKEILEAAYGLSNIEEWVTLEDVVSRKQQIVPNIFGVLDHI